MRILTKNQLTLFLLFSANIVSGFAQGITMIAIPWHLVHNLSALNGKWLNTALVTAVTFGSLFWGLYAGTLIDRYSRKRIFQILTLIDAFIICGSAISGLYLGYLPFPLIALVYTTTIFTYNVHYPNLYAFVQEIFDRSYYAKVNSAIEIQGQSTSFLGMMLGGIIIYGSPEYDWWPETLSFEAWKLSEIFLLDGCTYILGFFLITLIPYQQQLRNIDKGNILSRVRQGYVYLSEHKPLFVFGLASYVMFFSLLIIIRVLMPIYVSDYLRADALVLAAFKGLTSLGSVTAGVFGFSAFVKKGHLIRQIIGLMILGLSIYILLSITHSIFYTLFGAFLIGLSNAGIRILRITYIVRKVPNHIIGRVNSFFSILNVAMRVIFLSILTTPFFSDVENGDNIPYAFLLLGFILALAVSTLMLWFPQFDHKAAKE